MGSHIRLVIRAYYPFKVIKVILKYKDIKKIFSLSLVIFAITYIVAAGMLFKSPIKVSESIIDVDLAIDRPIGVYPWLTLIVNGDLVFSINLTASIFLVTLSTLFASNTSLLVYTRRYLGGCYYPNNRGLFASTLPSLFSTFSCCGGGLTLALSSTIFSAGIGGVYASIFIKRGWILAVISAALLYWNIHRMSKQIIHHIPNKGLRLMLPREKSS